MSAHEFLNHGRVLDEQIYKLQSEYIDVKIQLIDAIMKLDNPDEQVVLMEYYLNGRTWGEVAVIMGRTRNTVNRYRQSALQHMEEIINGGCGQYNDTTNR